MRLMWGAAHLLLGRRQLLQHGCGAVDQRGPIARAAHSVQRCTHRHAEKVRWGQPRRLHSSAVGGGRRIPTVAAVDGTRAPPLLRARFPAAGAAVELPDAPSSGWDPIPELPGIPSLPP